MSLIETVSKYDLSTVKNALSNPWLIRRELHLLGMEFNRLWYRHIANHGGVNVMEQDWDTLILLDSARADVFEKVNWIDGVFKTKESQASNSSEFIQKNFNTDTHRDIVYVSANPYTPEVEPGTFHEVVSLLSEWSDDYRSIPPEAVTEAALKAHEEFPKKRIVVHYMQPHVPYIGEYGQSLSPDPKFNGGIWNIAWNPNSNNSVKDLIRAYQENLEIGLKHAERVVESVSGKSVISSDHGELFGERLRPIPTKFYSHRPFLHVPELTTVPWLVCDYDERRKVVSEAPTGTQKIETLTQKQLEALGYR